MLATLDCGHTLDGPDEAAPGETIICNLCGQDERRAIVATHDQDQDSCDHPGVNAFVEFTRLTDSGRFSADVRLVCQKCGIQFCFLGLPAGVNLDGAAVSVDGTEGRFGIFPKGQVITELEGTPTGFSVKKQRQEPSEN